MNFIKGLAALSAAALVALLASPSMAAPGAAGGAAVLCSPDPGVGAPGGRTVGGSLSPVPSATIYVLNGQGCAVIKQADIGYFQSQGYSFAGDGGVIVWQAPVAATGTTSYQVGTLPAGAYIKGIFLQDSDTSHAVTGGITCGVSAADTTIMSTAQTAGLTTASVGSVTDAHILLRNFSPTAQQAIFCQAVTSWNTPTFVTVTIPYGYF